MTKGSTEGGGGGSGQGQGSGWGRGGVDGQELQMEGGVKRDTWRVGLVSCSSR